MIYGTGQLLDCMYSAVLETGFIVLSYYISVDPECVLQWCNPD